jgi:diguanylate cyclase (GGDEF)-like protein
MGCAKVRFCAVFPRILSEFLSALGDKLLNTGAQCVLISMSKATCGGRASAHGSILSHVFAEWNGLRFLCSVVVFSGLSGAAVLSSAEQHSAAAQKPPHVITAARIAHDLTEQQAALSIPVHLRAVVTYYDPYIDPRRGAIFVHDASGGVFIAIPARSTLPVKAGSVVDVRGVTAPGDFAPIIIGSQITLVGQSQVPRNPPSPTMAQLLSGSEDCQWVEVQGVVHAVHMESRDVILDIATAGGILSATTIMDPNANYGSLVDSLVRVHGTVAPLFIRSRQMVGIHLFFPSLHELTVVKAPQVDPFTMPAVPVTAVSEFQPGRQSGQLIHVQGTVTLQWPGRMLCIEDGKDGLCMQTADEARVSPGEHVDVVGFPVVSAFKSTLQDATFRVTGKGPQAEQATLITANQALKGDYDGQLVQFEGELIGQDLSAGDPTLMLSSGELLIPVLLPRSAIDRGALPWKNGSVVRVTGICDVLVSTTATNLGEGGVRPESARILLRSIDDVAILHTPSWWTPAHALDASAVVGIVGLAAFGTIVFLRMQVRQKTRALVASEAQLRFLSQHDPLTKLPNRILLSDRVQQALKRAQRFETYLALMMVDIDNFKDVNDALGHEAGDKLLCELARRLTDSLRQTDTVARIGGDEFVVLLPDLKIPVEAETVAGKILAAVASPAQIGSAAVALSVSVGVAVYPDGGTDMESLLRNADAAMYSVKARGKKGFQVYSENLARTAERATMPARGPQSPIQQTGS